MFLQFSLDDTDFQKQYLLGGSGDASTATQQAHRLDFKEFDG